MAFDDDLEQEFAEEAYLHAKAHDLGVDDDELEDLIASRGAFGITDEDLEELADEEE